jgi:hypothetical protein
MDQEWQTTTSKIKLLLTEIPQKQLEQKRALKLGVDTSRFDTTRELDETSRLLASLEALLSKIENSG